MTRDDLPPPPPPGASPREIDEFLEDVTFHYILRCEEGEPPDVDTYLARYPDHAEELAAMMAGGVDAPIVMDTPGTETRERRRGWSLKTIGGYTIDSLAASTGSSHVYKAHLQEGGEPVALKVHRRDQQVDTSEVERFRRESRLLGELGIEGVVPLIAVGEEEGSLFVAMPWINGITLLEAIAILRGDRPPAGIDPRPFSPQAKAAVIASIGRSLVEIHARGILHRDIKPSNIMIDDQGRSVLIDFGIARREGESALTRTGDTVQGTPRYLAPEILSGDALSTTEQGEVYALGLTFYELLVEGPAYDASSRKELFEAVLSGPPPRADSVNPEVPRALAAVADRALLHDPRKRFADMGAFLKALDDAMADPHGSGDSSRPILTTGAIILLLALLLLWALSR